MLFAGPSGTGKTMAAEIMAGELGLDLYKIDLSTVVSKYIGETEKNLARIFDEAETTNAILFFDEADALFGKRTEVRDSHDRYANIEISYLLQRMEEYDGIAILATNLRKNMDDAFVRRMHFTVEFPFPDARPTAGASGRRSGRPRRRGSRTWTWTSWPGASRSPAATSATSPWPRPSWPRMTAQVGDHGPPDSRARSASTRRWARWWWMASSASMPGT